MFVFFLPHIHQHQPFIINSLWILIVSDLRAASRGPPGCISRRCNGIFSYQAAYQIQIPMMDKSAGADALEWCSVPSVIVLPGDCVLLGCVTLWGPFGSPAELQWLQSLKVNFSVARLFCNLWKRSLCPFVFLMHVVPATESTAIFAPYPSWMNRSYSPGAVRSHSEHGCTSAQIELFVKWSLKDGHEALHVALSSRWLDTGKAAFIYTTKKRSKVLSCSCKVSITKSWQI